jgi:predicted nucleotidyltransferase
MINYGLPLGTIDKIITIMQRYPAIKSAILYGSRAKGTFKPTSDIDIVLKGEDVNLNTLSSVSIMLDDLLLPNKFDLSIYHHIDNQELSDHISRVGKTLYHVAS